MTEKNYYLVTLVLIVLVLLAGGLLYQQSRETTESLTATSTILDNLSNTINTNSNNSTSSPQINQDNQNKKMTNLITLDTSLGEIQFETYNDDAPNTVANFIKLANQKYYDGLIFHRVISGFMIQGGDPNCVKGGPCGAGGPGYQFADELNPATASYKAGYQKGVVAMANAGPNTNGSQFFIMLENYPLPNNYTIFGKVVKGQEIVDKIGQVATNEADRPTTDVVIKTATVE
ncbi:MAG TPA: peptidylprolyl isomerase [Candidatus Paceibacterota bacterium]|nr:peptidylprolyl isomerase [Candidatus Paceibacterota bacterium]